MLAACLSSAPPIWRDPHQRDDVLLHSAGPELVGRAVADDAQQRSSEAAVVAHHHQPGGADACLANRAGLKLCRALVWAVGSSGCLASVTSSTVPTYAPLRCSSTVQPTMASSLLEASASMRCCRRSDALPGAGATSISCGGGWCWTGWAAGGVFAAGC